MCTVCFCSPLVWMSWFPEDGVILPLYIAWVGVSGWIWIDIKCHLLASVRKHHLTHWMTLLSLSGSSCSHGKSPSNHCHFISANVCGRSHDVPQPAHSDVRLHARAGRRRAGCAQRLLPGDLGNAGVPRTSPRHRWGSEHTQLTEWLMWIVL